MILRDYTIVDCFSYRITLAYPVQKQASLHCAAPLRINPEIRDNFGLKYMDFFLQGRSLSTLFVVSD